MAFKMKGMGNLQAQHMGTTSHKKRRKLNAAKRLAQQSPFDEVKDPVWGDWEERSREETEEGTTITEGRTGVIPGKPGSRPVENIVKPGEPGYAEWYAAVTKDPDLEKKLGYVPTPPEEVEEERQSFIPREKEVKKVEQVKEEEEQMGGVNLGTIMGLNPNKAMTAHTSDYFNMRFSKDNPVFEVLEDDKFMRKARKEYNKNYKGKRRLQMPFEKWVTQTYKPKGQDSTIINMARTWEGTEGKDTDLSGDIEGREIAGASDVAQARYTAGPDDWKSSREIGVDEDVDAAFKREIDARNKIIDRYLAQKK